MAQGVTSTPYIAYKGGAASCSPSSSSPQSYSSVGWHQHLHSFHLEPLPGWAAVLWPAQGLSVLIPGDVGRRDTPGITQELHGGTRRQRQLCRLA
jgi:hypothetical protein